jgi:DNA-binding CsgD family transcriptional regulator/tetratricopeptide (TPR) repeat protein
MTTAVIGSASRSRGSAWGPGGTRLRGRDAQWRLVGELLRRTDTGSGGVLLVDGERGGGKSLLLECAVDEGAARGFSLAAGAATQLGGQLPLFALRMAVGWADDNDPESLVAQIGRVREQLARRAEAAPVLVTLDDLQWADQETLLALRVLPRELARYPIAWIFARSAVSRGASRGRGAECLFTDLEAEGALRAALRPLHCDIVTEMLADAFGAPPDDGLLELASGAGGNPALLADLIEGLREEETIRVADGRASLVSARLPRRISAAAQPWLDGSEPTRRLLETAAVLGGVFRLSDVAEVMGAATAALLPGIEEAMAAGILVADEDTFSFRHHLIARAAAESVPPPVRRVLHRQFGEILLDRAGSAADAARHLVNGAAPSDPMSLTSLDNGAARVLRWSPRTAADLAVRALRFTDPADSAALPRAVAAAETLAAAGQPSQAARIAYETLARPVPVPLEARLRCTLASILNMSGQADDAAAHANKVLGSPDQPDRHDIRDHAVAAWLQAATARGYDQHADRVAADLLAAPDKHFDHVVLAAGTACAMLRWDEGRTAEALDLLREAARQGGGVSLDARHSQPLLLLAARMIDLRRLDEAASLIEAAQDSGPDEGLAGIVVSILRVRMHLVNGRFDEAGAEAAAAEEKAKSAGADAYASVASSLLALVSLRQGRLHEASQHVASRAVLPPHAAAVYAPAETFLSPAQVAEVANGPAAAIGQIMKLCADPCALRRVLLGDPAHAVWLVRTTLAADDHQLVTRTVAAIEALASPDAPAMGAAAAHARGLLTGNADSLAYAAAHHADQWARASAAEDLGTLEATRGTRDEAIVRLNEAYDGYSQTGAEGDLARVRARLRDLGVRRRHWGASSCRPADGWESLTNTERAVSELVAQGLTNQQVAGRMYISTHTVAHHLRQAFRKLSVGSRVELARIVIEQPRQA